MNLPKIQALVAPLSAPIPSALGVALQAFLYFQIQSLFLAWIAAVGAFVGIEAIGGASCYAVVKLHRQKSYGIEFFVSLLGVGVYIFSGWLVLHTTVILIFFFLAPFAYFAYAILRNMETEHIEKVSETEAQIRLIEAQTKQINAETRKAKAERTEHTDLFGAVRDTVRPNEQQNSVRDKIYEVLANRSDIGPREMSRLVGCSVSTASKWISKYTTSSTPKL